LLSVGDFTRTYMDCQAKPSFGMIDTIFAWKSAWLFELIWLIMSGRCSKGTVFIVFPQIE